MAKFYPDIKRLFDINPGRKSCYTPHQIVDEFKLYIEDLENNPIEVDTNYRYQSENNSRRQQRRTQTYARPPKVLDFVTRWLGMTHQWWYALPNGKNGDAYKNVVERITQYCSDVKYDGAVIGIYNANIIARDLGLKENISVSRRDTDDNMTEADIDAEIKRLEKLDDKQPKGK